MRRLKNKMFLVMLKHEIRRGGLGVATSKRCVRTRRLSKPRLDNFEAEQYRGVLVRLRQVLQSLLL